MSPVDRHHDVLGVSDWLDAASAGSVVVLFYTYIVRPLTRKERKRRSDKRKEQVIIRGGWLPGMKEPLMPLDDRLIGIENDISGLAITVKKMAEDAEYRDVSFMKTHQELVDVVVAIADRIGVDTDKIVTSEGVTLHDHTLPKE